MVLENKKVVDEGDFLLGNSFTKSKSELSSVQAEGKGKRGSVSSLTGNQEGDGTFLFNIPQSTTQITCLLKYVQMV